MTQRIRRVQHCSHWGAYTILLDGNTIVGFEPIADDPAPSPVIQSVRGWADPAKRVLKPLVREGWLRERCASDGGARGRDRYVEVSWENALGFVAGNPNVLTLDKGTSRFGQGCAAHTCVVSIAPVRGENMPLIAVTGAPPMSALVAI